MLAVDEKERSGTQGTRLRPGARAGQAAALPGEGEGLKWTRHPVVDRLVPPLSVEQLRSWLRKPQGYDAALRYWQSHEELIRDAENDPLRCGFELPFWKDFRALLARKDELYALGGNGTGKTEIGGKMVAENLVAERGRKVLCVATNDNASKQLQQPAVYKYLPVSARDLNERVGPRRRSIVTKINWSQGGGFTEGTFVLPNRSQCWFKTVEQFERDKTSFEGPEYDLVWIDEPAPIALVDTLQYRVAKRAGKFLFTFTAVHGFDAVCNRVLTGARVIKSLPMNWIWHQKAEGGQEGAADSGLVVPELKLQEVQVRGLPAGHMPYLMQPLNPAQGVIFMWTHWNVFLPPAKDDPRVPDLFTKCRGKTRQTVQTRLFGWATKIVGCQFPKFSADVHVIPPERVPKQGTVYMSADPATARSYFLLWCLVDAGGRKFIFRESPSLEEGEWVTADGEKGDGQRLYAGLGTNAYKRYIRQREQGEGRAALKRFGDPRAFATEAAAREGGQSLFELYESDGGEADSAPMVFSPARVRATIQLDLEKVNDELYYDDQKPISVENEPHLYIAEDCQNLIRAMFHWSPDQGSDSPWKDPIDALRYLFGEPLFYSDPGIPEVVGGRGW